MLDAGGQIDIHLDPENFFHFFTFLSWSRCSMNILHLSLDIKFSYY